MRLIGALTCLAFLAACGVDGEPVRPALNTTVGVNSSGAYTNTKVTATRGNVTLGVGLGL